MCWEVRIGVLGPVTGGWLAGGFPNWCLVFLGGVLVWMLARRLYSGCMALSGRDDECLELTCCLCSVSLGLCSLSGFVDVFRAGRDTIYISCEVKDH